VAQGWTEAALTYREGGLGFSGPAIIGGRLYTMGGFDKDEYVIAIDLTKQKELWRVKVGKLFSHGAWGDGPRSTPTVDGDRVYALGGFGDLVCVDTSGKEVWRKSYADMGGEMMSEWGFSESVLIDGDLLICTPGGDKGTLAALDKKTGNELWRSKELKNKAPYSSVMISMAGGSKQYVQTSYINDDDGGVVSGFAPGGKVLWTQPIFKGHSYAIAPNPIIKDDLVYVSSGYGAGCHLFQLTAKGKVAFDAKDLYPKKIQKTVKNTHGGIVLIGDHIYGHSEGLGWVCQDLKSGEIAWSERSKLETRSGSITSADGMLYLLAETGDLALIAPDPKGWQEAGAFKLPEQSKLRTTLANLRSAAVWTHPVVANGRLYLRDQELIFCYDVSGK